MNTQTPLLSRIAANQAKTKPVSEWVRRAQERRLPAKENR